ncbi:hypothetical protein [Paenibacillus campinasensis]|uniref:Uncharacterized protein n=1 Tax=Paenibacillus campinasensis TaxID=66347 RepID=A0A268ETG6_9BACL|nr:hypothetical protein [Paenibacillus campinasensis]PAD76428.1 hypothetical protein CHH67_12465 [Paenibacillus campinasensis]
MFRNNEDIAKQHANDLRQEMERCRLAEQMRLSRSEPAPPADETVESKDVWKSLYETIAGMGRRIL